MSTFLSYKKICIAIFTLLFLLLFFWQSIASLFIEYYVSRHAGHLLEGHFLSERLEKNEKGWAFIHPRIVDDKGNILADMQSLKIDFGFHLLSRTLDLFLTIEEPKIYFSSNKKIKKKFKDSPLFFGLVHTKGHLDIAKGTVIIGTEESAIPPVFFDLHLNKDNKIGGYLTIDFGNAITDQPTAHVNFYENEKGKLAYKFNIKNLACSPLLKAAAFFWPVFKGWNIAKGQIDGSGELTLQRGRPSFDGIVDLRGLEFSDSYGQFRANTGKASLNFKEGVGQFSLTDESSLACCKEGKTIWEISRFFGNIDVDRKNHAIISFAGICQHKGKIFDIILKGDGELSPHESQDFLDITCSLTSENKHETITRFSTRQLGPETNFFELELNNFGSNEFQLLQAAAENYIPYIEQIRMLQGKINANITAFSSGLELAEVQINDFDGEGLALDLLPLEITCRLEKILGHMGCNYQTLHPIQSLQGEITLVNGNATPIGTKENTEFLRNVHSYLHFEKGVLEKNLIQLCCLGMDGKIFVDPSKSEIITYELQGDGQEIFESFMQRYPKALKNFENDQVTIKGKILKKEKNSFTAEGYLVLNDKLGKEDQLDFGFDLKNKNERQLSPSPLLKTMELLFIALNSFDGKKGSLDGYLHLDNGWFATSPISIKKYVEPFIFTSHEWKLHGTGLFKGIFDLNKINVTYQVDGLSLENSYFAIQERKTEPVEEKSKQSHFGEYHFGLNDGKNYGSLPLKHATYFEKNSGLLFTDIHTRALFDGRKIHFPEIECFCNGVFFAGDIDVDYDYPGRDILYVNIHSPVMEAKVSQIQHIFAHFMKPSVFLKIPLEGNVALRNEGANLNFAFQSNQITFHSNFHGCVTDGILVEDSSEVALRDLSLNFDYDSQANYLDLSDIQGTLLVGKSTRTEEYMLASDHIKLTDCLNNIGTFDFWVGDKNRDVIRLAGNSYPYEMNPEFISINLNKELTHFGNVHPAGFTLVLKNWSEVDQFKLNLNFQLNTLFKDLQRFSRSGLFFLSRSLLKELNELKEAKGDFDLELHYDSSQSRFFYNIFANTIQIANYQFNELILKGQKNEKTWIIDQMVLDNLSIAADIIRKEKSWLFNFLGLRYGNSLLAGLEGEYQDGDKAFLAKINLLETKFDHLGEWSSMKAFNDKYHPQGHFKGHGEAKIKLGRGSLDWNIEGMIKGNLQKAGINGIFLEDTENIGLTFNSEDGLVIKNLKSVFKASHGGSPQALANINKAEVNLRSGDFQLNDVSFHIPSSNLPWMAKILSKAFDDTLPQEIIQIIANLKQEDNLEGKFNFEYAAPHHALHLTLKEGTYHYQEAFHELANFSLEYDPCEFKIITQYKVQEKPCWLLIKSISPHLAFGEILITDDHPESEKLPLNPLLILWENRGNSFVIQKAKGSWSGLTFALSDNSSKEIKESGDHYYLKGEIKANLTEGAPLFPFEIRQKIADWGIGDGFSLIGKWVLTPLQKEKPFKPIFQGQLKGEQFGFRGYQFDSLAADLDYRSDAIIINNLHIADTCGTLSMHEAKLYKDYQGEWLTEIPKVLVSNFRPSLLLKVGASRLDKAKTLVIRQFECENLIGNIKDMNSLKGKGKLVFANPSKKNVQNILFTIPAEILSRIGLDLSVLNPVSGSIFFNIQDGKFLLTKFKDIYSEGKLSKFNLPDTTYQSYVDFEGNLHLQVRMKQYNLLFKLAELFTVTVQGTLQKPTYTLQKQNEEEKNLLPH